MLSVDRAHYPSQWHHGIRRVHLSGRRQTSGSVYSMKNRSWYLWINDLFERFLTGCRYLKKRTLSKAISPKMEVISGSFSKKRLAKLGRSSAWGRHPGSPQTPWTTNSHRVLTTDLLHADLALQKAKYSPKWRQNQVLLFSDRTTCGVSLPEVNNNINGKSRFWNMLLEGGRLLCCSSRCDVQQPEDCRWNESALNTEDYGTYPEHSEPKPVSKEIFLIFSGQYTPHKQKSNAYQYQMIVRNNNHVNHANPDD